MINEFVEEIKAKINHKKEYHKNFYEKLGQKLNDNDLHKATQLAFDDCMEFINELAEKYKDVPDTNVGKNLSENLIERLKEERNKQIIPYSGTTMVNAGVMTGLDIAIEIVNQLTEEFGGDINVGIKDAELIEKIKFGIEASNANDDYTTGLRNGMRYCLSLIDGKNPEFESCKQGWIPVSEHYPDTEKYILLSFSNFPIPIVGRWEEDENGGAFYIGDEDDSCVSQDLYVNAWQPLPQPYKGE